MPADRRLALLLRSFGVLDLLAALAVAAPRDWLTAAAAVAGQTLGPEPLSLYLARSASAMYVLHGALVVFISFDVVRYDRLIRFLAVAALAHGAVILGVDLAAGMPWWWCAAEGPGLATMGAAVLLVRGRR